MYALRSARSSEDHPMETALNGSSGFEGRSKTCCASVYVFTVRSEYLKGGSDYGASEFAVKSKIACNQPSK
jgi:hypothetical protein